jgi:hypothetical protein
MFAGAEIFIWSAIAAHHRMAAAAPIARSRPADFDDLTFFGELKQNSARR